MIRHIIAAIATLLALWAMAFMYDLDQKAERYRLIQEIIEKTKMEVKVEQTTPSAESVPAPSAAELDAERKKQDDEVAKKLKALKERAGNVMAFKVSPLYKQKCSSCHGVNGEGAVGPKLIGKNADEIHQALVDFKSGKRQNYVMYGLLAKLSDDQLKELADEIGSFQQKLEAAQ